MSAVKNAMFAHNPNDDDLDDPPDEDATPLEDVVRIWYEPTEGGEQ